MRKLQIQYDLILQVLRLARILRPLRLIKGNQSLRVMLEVFF